MRIKSVNTGFSDYDGAEHPMIGCTHIYITWRIKEVRRLKLCRKAGLTDDEILAVVRAQYGPIQIIQIWTQVNVIRVLISWAQVLSGTLIFYPQNDMHSAGILLSCTT
jgi:hypothetical protein